ncbi:SH3 domain-containing protein [Maritimibacter sp. DP1N21-5]|uniref:SH3 domain-containing protein n=1 Tax=Maritimibacter sp. DP1N21-5 TaxID=2836867 RepID=UPI001C4607A3|nr:SH3 domain-containing protein [Maritimibacter sp. DP1N21-5]MBV7408675.1 aspartyl-trna synthetase [Maritimibacter sp. DP1N21-5]
MTKIGAVLAFIGVVAGILVSAAEAHAAERGPVTNLPMPRYVSLKTSEANVRRGPSLTHRIDWVFTRRGMPLVVTGEFGHWRRVQDRDGVGGWIHYSLVSGARTGIVDDDLAPVLARAASDAQVKARLEVGVIVAFDKCGPEWCRVKAGGYKGWMEKTALWGVGPDETFE